MNLYFRLRLIKSAKMRRSSRRNSIFYWTLSKKNKISFFLSNESYFPTTQKCRRNTNIFKCRILGELAVLVLDTRSNMTPKYGTGLTIRRHYKWTDSQMDRTRQLANSMTQLGSHTHLYVQIILLNMPYLIQIPWVYPPRCDVQFHFCPDEG